jgi:DDE family transposase
MNEHVIAIFCICDEVIKAAGFTNNSPQKMNDAEVMSFALISALYYQADYRMTRLVSISLRYFSPILSHSRIVRRIHAIPDGIWLLVFNALKIYLHKSKSDYFIVDSFPVKAYENHKSFRAKIFRGKEYHGYTASKKQYFFGIKVHMIVDEFGIPIEFCFTSGSTSDIAGLKLLSCELAEGSILFSDKAYTDYTLEDDLKQIAQLQLVPKRKVSHKRQHPQSLVFLLNSKRNLIETVFSSITSRMPRFIKARTEKGFYLKVLFFIIAYLIHHLSKNSRL